MSLRVDSVRDSTATQAATRKTLACGEEAGPTTLPVNSTTGRLEKIKDLMEQLKKRELPRIRSVIDFTKDERILTNFESLKETLRRKKDLMDLMNLQTIEQLETNTLKTEIKELERQIEEKIKNYKTPQTEELSNKSNSKSNGLVNVLKQKLEQIEQSKNYVELNPNKRLKTAELKKIKELEETIQKLIKELKKPKKSQTIEKINEYAIPVIEELLLRETADFSQQPEPIKYESPGLISRVTEKIENIFNNNPVRDVAEPKLKCRNRAIFLCILGLFIILGTFALLSIGVGFHMNHLVTALKYSNDMLYISIGGSGIIGVGIYLHKKSKKMLDYIETKQTTSTRIT